MKYRKIIGHDRYKARFKLTSMEVTKLFMELAKKDKDIVIPPEPLWKSFQCIDFQKNESGEYDFKPLFLFSIREFGTSDRHEWSYTKEEVIDIVRECLVSRGEDVPEGDVIISAFDPYYCIGHLVFIVR